MKKTFSAKRNALFASIGSTTGAVTVVALLLIAGVRFAAPDLFFTMLAPVMRAGNAVNVKTQDFFVLFKGARALTSEVQALREENAALSRENARLAEALWQVDAFAQEPGILAGVVARPPQSPYDTLLIGAGSSSGVALGMEAFVSDGTPIGIVTDVSSSYARVTLFSSSGARMLGWVGQSRVPVTLSGAGGGAFTAELPKATLVTPGDAVYVPGPGALRVGTLARLESDPSSPSVTLYITPLVNPFAITNVRLRETGVSFADALPANAPLP